MADLALETLTAAAARRERAPLIALLQDVVDDGGSVGFLPPLSAGEAGAYWDGVAGALEGGGRVLWVARDGGAGIVGTVQLDLETRANGNHRGEIIKLMVHPSGRRRGVEALYRSLGWTFAGAIPQYARSATGALDATAIYYLLLGDRHG
jgi:acetyltransferase